MQTKQIFLEKTFNFEQTYSLPKGFRFRFFNEESDCEKWADILVKTDEFPTKKAALDRYYKEFTPYLKEVKQRMLFLETHDGQVIGTATAWYGEVNNVTKGRLHWVEIIPEFQSQGLGRPLIYEATTILKRKHDEAYLTTQARSRAAIHLYLDLGWIPLVDKKERKEAWDEIKESFF